jgi:4-amino-4-deoxy-L-arabinose transferase-like glycosyltransferase
VKWSDTLISNRAGLGLVCLALLASWCVGMFGRGYWTPDEPREADISWRMSWQADPAVPVLAGDAFCEKPPLTYWVAGASIRTFGMAGWAARIPNLFYAMVTTLCVAWLARRLAGALAATVAAAASATFLLSYQVAIWLATDAPLLAAVALALAGAYAGFYAAGRRGRVLGYCVLHIALAFGFLAKSAAVWIVPVLALATLIVLERRFRELLRWELWIGLPLQALIVGAWVWSVYVAPQGPEHLRVFLWDNLVGRFAHVNAPPGLQYTTGHRNFPGKYLLEMPIYLFPWTLLIAAAVVRAWQARADLAHGNLRILRWAFAASVPPLLLLSVAATARNIYIAPLLPGVALLLAWWVREAITAPAPTDVLALRATAVVLWLATFVAMVAVLLAGFDAGDIVGAPAPFGTTVITLLGAGACVALSRIAWRLAGRPQLHMALLALLLAYCCLLLGPASQVFRYADRWQDLAATGHELKADLAGAPLILIGPDETTRAWVDEYVRPDVTRAPEPQGDAAAARLTEWMMSGRQNRALIQLEGRALTPRLLALAIAFGMARPGASEPAPPPWLEGAHVHIVKRYELPNGRRYALLALAS